MQTLTIYVKLESTQRYHNKYYCLYLLVYLLSDLLWYLFYVKNIQLFISERCDIIPNMKRKHLYLIILTLILDQATKTLISSNMELFQKIPLIEGFFSITYVQNTGAAWSILEGNMLFFYMITIAAIVLMLMFYRSKECDAISAWGIALMLGGTLGNFLDRLRLQYVIDFFDFTIFGYDFPVFNIADICLCIGVGILLLSFVLEGVRKNEA